MFVSPINSYNNPFKANERFVMQGLRGTPYGTNTWFLRNDFDWKNFADFIDKKYKDISKVSFIDHACSSGYETYSIVATLISKLKEKAEKFFPIIARDIDVNNISMANEDDLELGNDLTIKRVKEYIPDIRKYFNIIKDEAEKSTEHTDYRKYPYFLRPKEILKKNINFAVGDIFVDLDQCSGQNNILFCRNFWPYLKDYEMKFLMNKIADKFTDSSSLIAIGSFDRGMNVDKGLVDRDFEETELKNIFCRK